MSEQTAPENARRLRRLLPGPDPQPSTLSSIEPKHTYVKVACDACHNYKAKCDGQRPTCTRCEQLLLTCHYSRNPGEGPSQALKRKYDALLEEATAHEELFSLLKTLPDEEAKSVLQKIRSGSELTAILKQVKDESLLLQLADQTETRFRYEFPYISEMPTALVSRNPYLDSLLYETTSLNAQARDLSTAERTLQMNSTEVRSLYLQPFHAAQINDARLQEIKPSVWTAVSDNDALMRDLLRAFLQCEYHFTSAFHKDYFLADMAAERHEFCSSLLVNIALAYSCACYPGFPNRAEYWNPNTLLYRFLAEAKRLWELEIEEARLTTVQAGILLNVFHILCGLDEIGQPYRIRAIEVAHELGLFGEAADVEDTRMRNGKAYTAWALYIWETLVSFSFMIPPLLTKRPDQHLPDVSKDPQWYGELYLRYPLDRESIPSYFGHIFKARCQLRIIMNEFCQVAYTEGSGVSLDKANQLHERLKSWHDGLPKPLQPKYIVLPAHLQLHMYYHILILSLYEPLLNTQTDQTPTPEQIVADASKHLQTLIRLYYLRHGFDAMDLFIVIPLVLAGWQCINAIDAQPPDAELETLRSTLMLIAKGLFDQRRNHYLAEALFRVIRGRMRPQEASLLKSSLAGNEHELEEKEAEMQTVRSHWPVSVVRRKEDVESHMLSNLVENYAHLNTEANSDAT